MRAAFFVAIAFCVAAATAPAGAAQPADARAEAYIRTSETQWGNAKLYPDQISLVKRILADDFVWFDGGKQKNKAETIAEIKADDGNSIEEHVVSIQVRVFGDAAVAQGTSAWTHKGGKHGHYVWTDTWLRRHGVWQIVASEDMTTK